MTKIRFFWFDRFLDHDPGTYPDAREVEDYTAASGRKILEGKVIDPFINPMSQVKVSERKLVRKYKIPDPVDTNPNKREWTETWSSPWDSGSRSGHGVPGGFPVTIAGTTYYAIKGESIIGYRSAVGGYFTPESLIKREQANIQHYREAESRRYAKFIASQERKFRKFCWRPVWFSLGPLRQKRYVFDEKRARDFKWGQFKQMPYRFRYWDFRNNKALRPCLPPQQSRVVMNPVHHVKVENSVPYFNWYQRSWDDIYPSSHEWRGHLPVNSFYDDPTMGFEPPTSPPGNFPGLNWYSNLDGKTLGERVTDAVASLVKPVPELVDIPMVVLQAIKKLSKTIMQLQQLMRDAKWLYTDWLQLHHAMPVKDPMYFLKHGINWNAINRLAHIYSAAQLMKVYVFQPEVLAVMNAIKACIESPELESICKWVDWLRNHLNKVTVEHRNLGTFVRYDPDGCWYGSRQISADSGWSAPTFSGWTREVDEWRLTVRWKLLFTTVNGGYIRAEDVLPDFLKQCFGLYWCRPQRYWTLTPFTFLLNWVWRFPLEVCKAYDWKPIQPSTVIYDFCISRKTHMMQNVPPQSYSYRNDEGPWHSETRYSVGAYTCKRQEYTRWVFTGADFAPHYEPLRRMLLDFTWMPQAEAIPALLVEWFLPSPNR